MAEQKKTYWWWMPGSARKYHIFEPGAMATSLCGKWLSMTAPESFKDPVDLDQTAKGAEDCAECVRKLQSERKKQAF